MLHFEGLEVAKLQHSPMALEFRLLVVSLAKSSLAVEVHSCHGILLYHCLEMCKLKWSRHVVYR